MRHITRIILSSVAGLSIFIGCASAATLGVGTVTGSGLRLRSGPDTDSAILDTASQNDQVIVLEKASGDWYKVSFDSQIGYMSADYISLATVADATIGAGVVDTEDSSLRMRSGPSTDSSILCSIPDNTVVQIIGINNGWYKITYNGQTGYVSSNYVSLRTVEAASTSSVAESSAGSGVIAYAKKYLGVDYVYGGSSPSGFDCSGFTMYVYSHFGYSLPHSASSQLKNGTSISRSNLKPGDLVFFRKPGSSYAATHVGIYVGNSQFIHACSTDDQVQISSLDSDWYSSIFVGGRRIVS